MDVCSVLRGIPAVVNHALKIRELLRNTKQDAGFNTCDFIDFFRCVWSGSFFNHFICSLHRNGSSVSQFDRSDAFEHSLESRIFIKDHSAGFIFLQASEGKFSGSIRNDVLCFISSFDDIRLSKRTAVVSDEICAVGEPLNKVKVGCSVLDHAVDETHYESCVRRRTNTNPIHITVGDVRHSRIDGDHAGTVCASNVQCVERTHSRAHRTADEKQITQVGVIRFHFAGAVKTFTKHPVAAADTAGVAGRGMSDVVRGAQRKCDPLAES